MKKLFLTLTVAASALLFTGVANADITTGNSNSSTTVINCVNNTHINSQGTGCIPNIPGGGSNPTPTPTTTPGNPGNPGGGSNGGGGGGGGTGSCTLGTPGNVTITGITKVSADSVRVSWTPASGATDYTIEYGTSSNSYSYGVPSTGNVTSYVIGSLDLSKAYFFKVIALNGCMQGNPSNEVSNVMGLSDTSSQDNSIALLAFAIVLGTTGTALLIKSIKKNA